MKGVNYKKKIVEEDLASRFLRRDFKDELDSFRDQFKNNEDCRKFLLAQRRWQLISDGKLSLKCPYCKNSVVAAVRVRSYQRNEKDIQSKSKVLVRRFQYRCPACRKEINATSGSLFKRQSDRLWLWFLTLYCMGLLAGKVPRTFLVKEYYQFLVGENEVYSSENSDELKWATYQRLGKQVDTAANKFSKLFGERKKTRRTRYLRYVGFKKSYRTDYVDWYSARRSSVKGWPMSWTPGRCRVDNLKASSIADNRGVDSVYDVHYIKKRPENINNTWVLCFRFSPSEGIVTRSIRWLYVDQVDYVELAEPDLPTVPPSHELYSEQMERYEKKEDRRQRIMAFAKFQLVQVTKNVKTLERPFRITNEFRKAFGEAVEKYGKERLRNDFGNNLLSCPAEILHETAKIMSRDAGINTQVHGSWQVS